MDLVIFCFDSRYFKFNDNFYKQIFGTAMENLFSLVLANMAMSQLLTQVKPQLEFIYHSSKYMFLILLLHFNSKSKHI